LNKTDKRKDDRSRCYGKIIFLASETPGYIRDISSEGMKVDCPAPFSPVISSSLLLPVEVVPVEDMDFRAFTASAEVRWLQKGKLYTSIGLMITGLSPEAEKDYEKILFAYKAHSSEDG
jgi:hypothetical protein